MEVFKDGVNASEYAEDYRKETLDVNNNAKIAVKMAAGGGWAAIISRK